MTRTDGQTPGIQPVVRSLGSSTTATQTNEPVTDVADFEEVVALLHDEYAREILGATSLEPMSASALTDRCDASRQTVYRRLDRLEDAGLVAKRTRPREDGNHDAVYEATLEQATVRLEDGTFEFELDQREPDMADELTRLWGDL